MLRSLVIGIALSLSASPFLTAGKPACTDKEVLLLRERFEKLQEGLERNKDRNESAVERGTIKREIGDLNLHHLGMQYLRHLMDLERDLVLYATPAEKITAEAQLPSLSRSDNARLAKLRLEMLAKERQRIASLWADRRPLSGDKRLHEGLLRNEETLEDFFEKATRKIDPEIKKIRKSLQKEESSSIPNKARIDELFDELEPLLEQRNSIYPAIFGFAYGAGFDRPHQLTPETAETLAAELQEERERVLAKLRDNAKARGESERKSGVVGGIHFYSSNLGVILDTSPSMRAFIPRLKEEIAESFDNPHYREVIGCRLRCDVMGIAGSPNTKHIAHTMVAIEDLLVIGEVDTVYWFCDLQDGYSAEAIRRLRYLLQRTGAAFHVKSVGQKPDRELRPLIDGFSS